MNSVANASTNHLTVPKPSTLAHWLHCIIVLGVHFLLTLILILVLARLVPSYMLLFEKVNLTLPAITEQLYYLSRFFVDYWYLILFLGMIIDVPAMIVLTLCVSRLRWLRTIYEYVWLLGACLILFWIALCLAMPIEKMALSKEPLQ